jgi:ubiquinone/menaquinone biosynthesis C-methylase UbiE
MKNKLVRDYWEQEPCGTSPDIVEERPRYSREWFEAVETYRYKTEPFIHSIAQFTRHRGEKVLEIGVGAGTDHLQFARAGADLYGVDLTDAAIETTRARLALYGLTSNLQRIDAEKLPFPDGTFDVVYSWGVIHHADHPEEILREVFRVLKPGGRFIGMFYRFKSLTVARVWLKHALFKGKPWIAPRKAVYDHVESVGTKCYTDRELQKMFGGLGFRDIEVTPFVTLGDHHKMPKFLVNLIPATWGWFAAIDAKKP